MPKAATRSVLLAAMLTLGLTGLATTPATAATKPKPKPESPRPPAVSVQRAGGQLAMTSSGRSAVQRPAAAEPPQRTVPPAKPAKAAAPTPPANPPPTGHAQHRTSCPSAGHRRTRAITCVTVVQLDAQTPAPAPPVSSQPLAGTSTRSVVAGGDVPFPQGCTTEYATPSRTLTCRHVMEYWTTRDQQNGDVLGTQALEIWEYWQTDLRTLTIVHGLQVATRETTGTAFASGATVSVSNPCMSSPVMGNGVSCTATEAFTGPDPQYVMPDTFLSNRWTETIGLGSAGSVSPRTLPSAALLVEVSPTVPPLPNTTEVDALLVDDAWRCDDLVSGTGCVDPEYTPTITFNTGLNPLVRPVALHMRDAQAELPQHWGVPGGDHPLLRLTDPTQASANTRAACASFVPDPPVATSCDEYPFASSYEGGAGASIRAVPLSANNSQGGILNGGYNTWRILDADAFYVQVIIDDTNTEKVMVVGDSISQGLDGDFTWRYRLWQHFQSDGVIDAFVGPRTGTHDLYSGTPDGGGYRVAGWEDAHDALWGRAALDEQNTIEGITSQYRPDVILVEMGINDLVWFSTPDELIDTMRNLVGNARLANPDAKFVIGNVMDRTPLSDWPDLPGKIDSYDALLPGLVSSLSTTQSPVVMADLHAALDPATDTHDGLHPNEIGEYKIAATFADTLATAYGIGQDFGPIPTSVPELTMTTPTLTVTANDGGALLSWTHSYGADGYWIWAENVSGGETTLSRLPLPIGDDHWQAGALADGQTVKYAVQSRRSDTNVSDLSNAVQVTVHPKTPQYTAATYSTSCTGCNTISTWWDPITGADSYQVLWVDETLDPNTLLSAPSSTTSYTISAIPGHEYVIAVSGVNQYGDGVASGVPEIYAGLGAPDTNQLTVCQYTGGWTAHLEWTAVPGATGYMIWTRNWVNGDPFTPLAYPVQSLSFDPGLMVDGSLNHEFAIQPVNGSMAAPLSNAMRVS